MKDSLKIALGIIIGVLGSAACCIGAFFVITTVILAPTSIVTPAEAFPATPSPISPVATATPTPLPSGETWVVENLAISVLEHEVAGCYTSEDGSERCPPDGAAYLWIHLYAEHIGDVFTLPVDASFTTTLFYRGEEQNNVLIYEPIQDKPHWPGYSDGSGNTEIYSGTRLEGWLVFLVPAGAGMRDVIVQLDNWRGQPDFKQGWSLSE